MKKRILLVLLTLALAIALVIPMAIPVAASGGTTLSLNVQGYEIFAGIVNGGYRYGATFIAQVSGDYNGVLTVSTNYHVAAPVPGGENDIIGGSWTLTLVQNGKTVGTIVGKISGGSVEWYPRSPPDATNGTDYGIVTAPITFMGISKTFAGKSGYGSFNGQDLHASKVYLFGIEVPVVTGTISLNFTN
jgi:hypothetical protein